MNKSIIAGVIAAAISAPTFAADEQVVVNNGTYADQRCGSVAAGGHCEAVTKVDLKGGTLVVDGKNINVEDMKYDDTAIKARLDKHRDWLTEDKDRLNDQEQRIHVETVERMAVDDTLTKANVSTNARIDDVVEKQAGLAERDEHLFKQAEIIKHQSVDRDAALQTQVDTKVSNEEFAKDQARQDSATAENRKAIEGIGYHQNVTDGRVGVLEGALKTKVGSDEFANDQARQDAATADVAQSVKDEAEARQKTDNALHNMVVNVAGAAEKHTNKVADDAAKATADVAQSVNDEATARREMDGALKGAIEHVAAGSKSYTDKATAAIDAKVQDQAREHAVFVEGQKDEDANQWHVIENNKTDTDAAIEATAKKAADDIRYTQDVVDQYGQENDARVGALEGTVVANDQAAKDRDVATNARIDVTDEKVSRVNQKAIDNKAEIEVIKDNAKTQIASQSKTDSAQNTAITNIDARVTNVVTAQTGRDQGQDDAIAKVGKGSQEYTNKSVTEVKNYSTQYTNTVRYDLTQAMETARKVQSERDTGQDKKINDAQAVADRADARSAQNTQRIEKVEERTSKLEWKMDNVEGAMAGMAAALSMPSASLNGTTMISAGAGYYQDKAGLAVGGSHRFENNVTGKFHVSGEPANMGNTVIIGAGVGYQF